MKKKSEENMCNLWVRHRDRTAEIIDSNKPKKRKLALWYAEFDDFIIDLHTQAELLRKK